MPRSRDLAVFVTTRRQTTDNRRQTKPIALPLAHARGVINEVLHDKYNNNSNKNWVHKKKQNDHDNHDSTSSREQRCYVSPTKREIPNPPRQAIFFSTVFPNSSRWRWLFLLDSTDDLLSQLFPITAVAQRWHAEFLRKLDAVTEYCVIAAGSERRAANRNATRQTSLYIPM